MKKELLIITIMISSCGKPAKETNPEEIGSPGDFKDHFSQYFLEDPSCLGSGNSTDLYRLLVRQWNGSQVNENHVDIRGVTGAPNLSGPIVKRTLVSHSSESTCVATQYGYKCPDESLQNGKPVYLPLCKGSGDYSRNSYEGIGATSLYHIESAYSYYMSLNGSLASLPRVNLFVLPKVERTIVSESDNIIIERKSLENNLSYVDNYYDYPTFMIHPTKLDSDPQTDMSRPNLWESSWALSHEFGHHILTTHTGLTTSKLNSLVSSSFSNSTAADMFDAIIGEEQSLTSGYRYVSPGTVWGALNEGFADLFGYFSTGETKGQTHGIECFGKTRDLTSAVFEDGSSKQLSEQVYNLFYSDSQYATGSCNVPNYQSIHVMGALIAHGLYNINNSSESPRDGGVKLIRFANEVGDFVKENRQSFELSDLVAVGVKAISGADGKLAVNSRIRLDPNVCYTAQKSFPKLVELWNRKGYFECNIGQSYTGSYN